MALTKKRRVFIEEYLRCWNGTEAAKIAGFAHPGSQGHRLLKNVEIQAEIKRRIEEKCMAADEVLIRLAEQARVNMADFITISRKGEVKIDLIKARRKDKLHLVKKIGHTKHGLRLELHDAQAALVHLGRYLGLFVDKIAPTDPTGEQPWNPFVAMSDDELDEAIQRMEQRRKRAISPAAEGAVAPGSGSAESEDPGGEGDAEADA